MYCFTPVLPFVGCWTNKDGQRRRNQMRDMRDPGELDTQIDYCVLVALQIDYCVLVALLMFDS